VVALGIRALIVAGSGTLGHEWGHRLSFWRDHQYCSWPLSDQRVSVCCTKYFGV
jgi:hypothetical protein